MFLLIHAEFNSSFRNRNNAIASASLCNLSWHSCSIFLETGKLQPEKKGKGTRKTASMLSLLPRRKSHFRAAFRSTAAAAVAAAAAAEVGLLLLPLLSGQHKKEEITGLNIQLASASSYFCPIAPGRRASPAYLIAYTSGHARAAKQLRSKISQVCNCHVKQFFTLRYRQTIQCSHRHFTVHS